jgi:hypothetical protein
MTNTNVASVLLSDQPASSLPWKDRTLDERLAAAQEFLRGTKPSLADLRNLAAALKDNDKRFTHARRLLVRARRHDDYKKQDEKTRRKVLQQLALCTYKDDDLPAERRFKRALDWLQEIATLDELKDQESLCLAGAIFKRQWETTGQISFLKQSLAFYRRGHEVAGPTSLVYDGYGAINAAFVSDLMRSKKRRPDRTRLRSPNTRKPPINGAPKSSDCCPRKPRLPIPSRLGGCGLRSPRRTSAC